MHHAGRSHSRFRSRNGDNRRRGLSSALSSDGDETDIVWTRTRRPDEFPEQELPD